MREMGTADGPVLCAADGPYGQAFWRGGEETLQSLKRELDRMVHRRSIQKKHIVVCGFPRSGTSLFYNMLAATLEGFRFDDRERTSLQTIKYYDNHVSKSPLDTFHRKGLQDHNIHRKEIIVFLFLRDIRDILTSIHPNAPHDYFIGYEACYRIAGEYPDYEISYTLPGIGAYYREIERWKHADGYHVRLVNYEELVRDPDQIQESIRREQGFSFKGKFSEFHLFQGPYGIRYEGVTQALAPNLVKENREVSTEGIGRWKEEKHRDRIIRQFSAYPDLFAILQSYGYTKDDEWFREYETQSPPVSLSSGGG